MSDYKEKSAFSGPKEPHTEAACAAWAVLLPDMAEGLLSTTEQALLEQHIAGCSGCARELADAQRGAAWMALLKEHAPEPPEALFEAILARTSGADGPLAEPETQAAPIGQAVASPSRAIPVGGESFLPEIPVRDVVVAHDRQGHFARLWAWLGDSLGVSGSFAGLLQPRLAMTSAMAFFSVCLTLNLLGISVRDLSAQSLRPASLQRTVADKGATLVRSFEGIRVVYRVESRVNEWRTASATPDGPTFGSAR